MQGRLAAGRVEGAAQHLAVDRDDALAGLGEAGHEALETGAELLRIEPAEEAAEGVVARRTVCQFQEITQKPELGFGELGHVGAVFAAGQHGAERNDQHLQQIVPPGVAGARVVQPGKAGSKTIHGGPQQQCDARARDRIPAPPRRKRLQGLSS